MGGGGFKALALNILDAIRERGPLEARYVLGMAVVLGATTPYCITNAKRGNGFIFVENKLKSTFFHRSLLVNTPGLDKNKSAFISRRAQGCN